MIHFWIIAILVALFTPKVWANDAISDIGNEWESRIGRDTQPQQGSAPTLCFQKGAGYISCFEQRKAATSGGKYCLYKSPISGAFAASCNPSGDLGNKGDATGGKQDSSSSGSNSSSGNSSGGNSSGGNSSGGNSSGGNSSGGNSSGGSVSVVGGGGSSSAGGGSAAGTSSSSSSSSLSERRETPESVRKAYEAWQKKWQDEFKRLENIAVSIKEGLANKLQWCITAYGGGTPGQIKCSNDAIAEAKAKLDKLKEQIASAEAQAAKELAELNKQYNVGGSVGSPTPPTVIVDSGSANGSNGSNGSNSNSNSNNNGNSQHNNNSNGNGGTTHITNHSTSHHTTNHNTTNNITNNNYTMDNTETNGLLATISGKMGELGTAIKDLAGKVKELATGSGNKDSGSHDANSSNNGNSGGITPTPNNTGNATSNANSTATDDDKDNSAKEEPKEEQPKDVKFDSNNDDLDGKAPTKDLSSFDIKGYFASSGTCPPPYSVHLGFLGQWQLSYDWFCKVANAMRGVVIGFAWLAGLMIIVKGTRRA